MRGVKVNFNAYFNFLFSWFVICRRDGSFDNCASCDKRKETVMVNIYE